MITLLGIYLGKTIMQKKSAYTPIFIAALLTIGKTWKQPKCLSTDKWIRGSIPYYSVIKKKETEIVPFEVTWIDLEMIILREVSQKEKDKYHVISLICGIENMTNEPVYKTDTGSQT